MTITAFAFGDPATGIWGVAATDGETRVASFAPELDIDDEQDESLLGYGGLELRFAPTVAGAGFAPAPTGIAGRIQLCTVEGAVHWEGTEQELGCLGMRATLELPSAAPASARALAAWLDPEDGFALVALRPPRSAGHEQDVVACALLEDGAPLDVEEPRFSTTYDGDGVPSRAGVELWLVGSGDDEQDDERDDDERDTGEPRRPDTRYPRRAAGERAGDGAELTLPGLTIRADLFTWHARGIDGAGVYLLAPAPAE